MGIVIVMLVLVLGYYYTSNYSPEKVLLKRSTGWEAYVHLAKFGLEFLLKGAFLFLFFVLVEYIISLISECLFDKPVEFFYSRFISIRDSIGITLEHIILILFSFVLLKGQIEDKNNIDYKYNELGRVNGILSIIIQAVKNDLLVKVSLKSKKVYVGLVDSEQFESADLDNVVIIPFKSGYRDKDTLALKFDCDYIEVYRKKGIDFSGNNLSDLRKFRCAIRVSEIESISLFDTDYYHNFQVKQNKKRYFLKGKK